MTSPSVTDRQGRRPSAPRPAWRRWGRGSAERGGRRFRPGSGRRPPCPTCRTAQVDRPNRGTDDEGGTGSTMHEGADQRIAVGSASNRVLGEDGNCVCAWSGFLLNIKLFNDSADRSSNTIVVKGS
jgi:hypothetical protein